MHCTAGNLENKPLLGDPAALVIDRLQERGLLVAENGSSWTARCPVPGHGKGRGDANPSLSIARGQDGRVLLKCHAGCPTAEVAAALGLETKDLFERNGARPAPSPAPPTPPREKRTFPTLEAAVGALVRATRGRHVATWMYHYGNGAEALAVTRLEPGGPSGADGKPPKLIRPLHPVEDGWAFGDPLGDFLPLYELPKIRKESRVFIVEGEKATDAGWQIGLPCTTSAHGARSADRTDWTPIKGKEVVILPDNDEPGRQYAADVLAILGRLTNPASIRVVELPGLPEGGDLADFVAMRAEDGKEPEAIRAEVEHYVEKAAEASRTFARVERIGDMRNAEVPTWLVEGVLFQKAYTVLGGDPKSGKTTLALTLAIATLAGRPFLGRPVMRTGPVVVLEADMGTGYFTHFVRQLAAGMGVAPDDLLRAPLCYRCTTEVDLLDAGTRDAIGEEIASLKPALVILDPLRDLHSGNENDSTELKPALDFCLHLRDRAETAVIAIDHLKKPTRGGGSGPAGYDLRGSGSKYARADSVLIARDVGGSTRVSGTHRYAGAQRALTVRLVDETETSGGLRLVEVDPPTDGEPDARPSVQQRVEAAFRERGGEWISLRQVRDAVRTRHDLVRTAVSALHGRGLVEHDAATPDKRRWRWIGPEGPEET